MYGKTRQLPKFNFSFYRRKLLAIINESYREHEKWVGKVLLQNQLPRPMQRGKVTKERSATCKEGRDTQRQW